jgi:hypothetical protein
MPLLDSAFFLLRKLMKNLTEVTPKLRVEHLSPTFRDEHDVVLALPLRMV